MDPRILLITLLIKMGAAAAIAGALVRSREFKQRVFVDKRTVAQQTQLVLLIATPYALGVVARKWWTPADLSLECVLLVGALSGRFGGALAGVLVGLPTVFFGPSEWLALPFFTFAGFVAGVLRNSAPNYEDIWSFSPFIDLSLYRWLKRSLRHPRLDWLMKFSFLIVALRFAQMEVA